MQRGILFVALLATLMTAWGASAEAQEPETIVSLTRQVQERVAAGRVGEALPFARRAIELMLQAMIEDDFATIDASKAQTAATALLADVGPEITALGRAVLQCYYRDDRVLRSLGLEPRAPFPNGHALAQGDWSLLEAIRGRPPMWRDVERKAGGQ